MGVNFTYDRSSFFANLRAKGYAITAEQEAQFDKEFYNQSPNGDLFSIAANGFNGAIAFFQNLLKSLGFDVKLTDISSALDDGQLQGTKSGIDRYMHVLRNKAQEIGIDHRTAAAITGDISTGEPLMEGNLGDVLRAQANILPASGQRFAAADTSKVDAPNVPLASNPTRTLTGNTPSA